MKTKSIYGICFTALMTLSALSGCKTVSGKDKYDKKGRLILELQNLYFSGFDGADIYTELLNDKFNVNIKPSNYSYNDWDQEVNIAIGGNNILDTIHFNLKAYNYGTSYERWVKNKIIKPLPDDMSKWPNLQAMLNNITNIDALKIDGKLYGIPVANDISVPEKDFSNFTYVYRRDWAKEYDEANPGKEPIYKEGDVYTWEEFNRLLKAFKIRVDNSKTDETIDDAEAVMMDESWGFPSVTNFYKDVPHCFAKDEQGKAINAFTSDKYVAGLEEAKDFVSKVYYSQDQFTFIETTANTKYANGLAGILYDNWSLSNYIDLRKAFKKNNKNVNLEDGTALMKVMGPDGNFALEGTENWFSMTMFNYDISDTKMEKILDILDYLLSEEGTRLAIYGKEGYDYNIVDGKVELTEVGWEKDANGNYSPKPNGAKYLRYMATLGNDTKAYDPFTDMDAFNLINDWQSEMREAKANNKLRVVKEPADIDWMSAPNKNDKTQTILADANKSALKYCFGKLGSIEAYKSDVEKNVYWKRILDEINERLGF